MTPSVITLSPSTMALLQNKRSLMEMISFRPKTIASPLLVAMGLGVFYSLNVLMTPTAASIISTEEDRSKRRQRYCWDFFDPIGHHEINE